MMSSEGNFTEDAPSMSVQRIIAAWLFATTSFLGVLGNILVIVAVSLSRRLQTKTNIFVVALAVIDLLTCLLLPVQVMSVTGVGSSVSFGRVCTVTGVAMSASMGVSVTILVLIAFNRFYMITKPKTDYTRLYTKRNIMAMIGACAAVPSFNVVLAATGLATFGLDEGICSHAEGNSYSYTAGAWLLVSLLIIVICYIKIYQHVRRHLRSIGSEEPAKSSPQNASTVESTKVTELGEGPRLVNAEFAQRQRELESKITTNMLIVIVLFFMCVTPSIIILFVPDDHGASSITVAIIAFNSCLNPIVYAWKHPVFRHVFKCIITRQITDIKEPTQWARSLVVTHS